MIPPQRFTRAPYPRPYPDSVVLKTGARFNLISYAPRVLLFSLLHGLALLLCAPEMEPQRKLGA